MHKYFLNSKEITKAQWEAEFFTYPQAHVILKTQQIPSVYVPPLIDSVISAEKARELRGKRKA